MGWKGVGITIVEVIVISEIVIQDQVLDTLLLLALGLLLVLHRHSKSRVRRQVNRACLQKVSFGMIVHLSVKSEHHHHQTDLLSVPSFGHE